MLERAAHLLRFQDNLHLRSGPPLQQIKPKNDNEMIAMAAKLAASAKHVQGCMQTATLVDTS